MPYWGGTKLVKNAPHRYLISIFVLIFSCLFPLKKWQKTLIILQQMISHSQIRRHCILSQNINTVVVLQYLKTRNLLSQNISWKQLKCNLVNFTEFFSKNVHCALRNAMYKVWKKNCVNQLLSNFLRWFHEIFAKWERVYFRM